MPRYALVIGIAIYDKFRNLPKAATDAEAIAQLLEQHQYNVTRLPRKLVGDNQWAIDPDKPLSYEDLKHEFLSFLQERANKQEVVFYFAGHGFRVLDDYTNKQEGFLAASDTDKKGQKAMPFNKFNQAISQADLSSLVMLMDCCYAGSVLEHRTLLETTQITFKNKRNSCLIAACRDFERAREGKEYGIFTAEVLKGLSRENATVDGVVTSNDLFGFVERKLGSSGQEVIYAGTGSSIPLINYQLIQSEKLEHKEELQKTDKKSSFSSKKILFLSANPENVQIINKSGEFNEIQKALSQAKQARSNQGKSKIISTTSIDESNKRGTEISRLLVVVEPNIIHVWGSEEGIENLILEDSNIFEKISDAKLEEIISDFFRLLTEKTQCVVLSGCYSEKQARKIIEWRDFLIGIKPTIKKANLIDFIKDFYYFIGLDFEIKAAYHKACHLMEQRGTNKSQLPILLDKKREIERKEIENQLATLEEEIEEYPTNIKLWMRKGRLLEKLNLSEEVAEAYERASLLDPQNADIRIEQGDTFEKLGEHERAVFAYSEALNLGEGYKIWWKKGKALARLGKYKESQEAYANALLLDPPSSVNYIICREYGYICEELGRQRKSIELYNKALEIEPRYRAAKYKKKELYKKIYLQNG
jgi:tetratricopeptide (TPR) repeat protein